jgi:hypothetical protein
MAGLSSSTRGIFAGGNPGAYTNVIQYVTIASTGNATDFGDLLNAQLNACGTSSTTRGVIAAGEFGSNGSNIIEYITIATTGNSTDFGDLTQARRACAAVSGAHGGLSA